MPLFIVISPPAFLKCFSNPCRNAETYPFGEPSMAERTKEFRPQSPATHGDTRTYRPRGGHDARYERSEDI